MSGYAPPTYAAPVRRRLADPRPYHARRPPSLWARWATPPSQASVARAGWLLLWIGTIVVAFTAGIWLGATLRVDVLVTG